MGEGEKVRDQRPSEVEEIPESSREFVGDLEVDAYEDGWSAKDDQRDRDGGLRETSYSQMRAQPSASVFGSTPDFCTIFHLW